MDRRKNTRSSAQDRSKNKNVKDTISSDKKSDNSVRSNLSQQIKR